MRQRLQWLAGLVLLVLAVALGAATHVALERRQTARHERDQATTALRQARSGRADRWAPEALARAEEANRRALGVMQAAEAHLPIFASYPEAARAWLEAGDAAREAAAQASASEEDMRRQCDEMISSAGRVLTEVQAAAEHARLEADSRSLLSRAQLALIESRILQRQEDYVGAMARAGWAIGAGNRLSGETANMTARYSDAELVATWSRWKTQLIARSRAEGQAAILIEKADHRLTLYRNGELVESFPVDLGPNWIPAKSHAGDSATPEGQDPNRREEGARRNGVPPGAPPELPERTRPSALSSGSPERTSAAGCSSRRPDRDPRSGRPRRGLDQWLHRDDQRRHRSVVRTRGRGHPCRPHRGRLATTLRAHCSEGLRPTGRTRAARHPSVRQVRRSA